MTDKNPLDPDHPHSIRSLLTAYEHQELDFESLVQLIVKRYKEIGPQGNDEEEETWNSAERIPDADNGFWINAAHNLGVLNSQEVAYIEHSLEQAFGGQDDSELFL